MPVMSLAAIASTNGKNNAGNKPVNSTYTFAAFHCLVRKETDGAEHRRDWAVHALFIIPGELRIYRK